MVDKVKDFPAHERSEEERKRIYEASMARAQKNIQRRLGKERPFLGLEISPKHYFLILNLLFLLLAAPLIRNAYCYFSKPLTAVVTGEVFTDVELPSDKER